MESKRTEKLASALYLLTSFFGDMEPMKWRLRDLGGKLLSRGETRHIVLEVMSLLSVAKSSGLISDTNFAIIYPEFATLTSDQSLTDLLKQEDENLMLDRPVAKPVEKPESKPIYISSSLSHAATPAPTPIKDKSPIKESGSVAIKKNNRQNAILATLKKKKEIMVKDVSPLIPGVSEKTIQRELLAMVSAGILRKIGEKRWSRYTLAE